MKTYKAKGKLIYYPTWWLVLYSDDEICKYYRKLVNLKCPWIKLNPPKHPAHISVIYGQHEQPKNKEFWEKYENTEIEFDYEPFIIHDREYYWMKVTCQKIEDIRVELGLPPHHGGTPWHLTIGNLK